MLLLHETEHPINCIVSGLILYLYYAYPKMQIYTVYVQNIGTFPCNIALYVVR